MMVTMLAVNSHHPNSVWYRQTISMLLGIAMLYKSTEEVLRGIDM
jgi:hypothetical protein